MSCKGLTGKKLANCKSLSQKHIVKTKTVIKSNGTKNKTTKTNSEVTNIESKSNRRTQKVSTSSFKNPKGSTSTLVTKKDPKNNGRVILGDDGSWNTFGSSKGKRQVKKFQRASKNK